MRCQNAFVERPKWKKLHNNVFFWVKTYFFIGHVLGDFPTHHISTTTLLLFTMSSGLRILYLDYILQQINRVLWSLKCNPCPPAPVLAHTTWDQFGRLRLAPL